MSHPPKVHERLAEIPAAQVGSTVVAIVDDPYSQVGAQIAVMRSVRDDPLAGMYARSQIDTAQYSAGRQWQRIHEQAAVGALKSIDPTQEPVDGHGPPHEPFTDVQRHAFAELKAVAVCLGFEGDRLVRDILGDRVSLFEAAQRRSRPKKYIGQRFRECLETLAKLWGFA
jgi:hypothetical protein